ncbi:MAG: HAD hydrolase-like protein [Solirubrobacteraceae bacterium]
MVGDTPHDVDGAHAAGMACVGVGSHHFDVDQLRAHRRMIDVYAAAAASTPEAGR